VGSRRIKLYADYSPWCLWEVHGDIDFMLTEDALPLSGPLIDRIKAWFNAYDSPRPGWPLWEPADGETGDIEREWSEEAESLRAAIARELGANFEVVLDL